MSDSGTIRVYRSRANLMDLGLGFTLMIDGADAGQIWSRQTKVFEVMPGAHRVYVRFLWLRKSTEVEVVLTAGQEKELACHTNWVGYPVLRPATQKDAAKLERDTPVSPAPRDLGADS
jgi:hypothetical protein